MTCYTTGTAFINIRIFHAMNFADKMPSPHRLLIVGAGLTGSVTASLLRRKFPKDVLSITVWEKSRGAGGRMTTNRSPSDPRCTADLGAQYISATSAYAKSHERQVGISIRVTSLYRGLFIRCVVWDLSRILPVMYFQISTTS